jgi:hypothetical protein
MDYSKHTALALALLGCIVAGCGQNPEARVAVSGRVLIDGDPLTGGTIRFVPETGRPASSAIHSDGTFRVSTESVNQLSKVGLARGKYRVQVSASNVIDDATIRWNAPARYADFRTSGLGVAIEKPTDDLVIELTWAGAHRSDAKTPAAANCPSNTDSKPPSGESEGGNAI